MSIFYFSTCLQREAEKKDLLGLFVAIGGRVPFVCSPTRQMLQVKLSQRGQSCLGVSGEQLLGPKHFLFFFSSLCGFSVLWDQVLYGM